jgi:hypothetical protein
MSKGRARGPVSPPRSTQRMPVKSTEPNARASARSRESARPQASRADVRSSSPTLLPQRRRQTRCALAASASYTARVRRRALRLVITWKRRQSAASIASNTWLMYAVGDPHGKARSSRPGLVLALRPAARHSNALLTDMDYSVFCRGSLALPSATTTVLMFTNSLMP